MDRRMAVATDRRSLLAGFAALMAAMNVPALAQTVAPDTRFFTPSEHRFLSALSDTLIPATDTPGAVGAGVPDTFDAMMVTWASPVHRAALRTALAILAGRLNPLAGGNFSQAPAASRAAALSPIDQAAFGAKATEDSDYRAIKSLIAELYYTSEIGASQELIYDPMPGEWLGDIPFTDIGKTWAT